MKAILVSPINTFQKKQITTKYRDKWQSQPVCLILKKRLRVWSNIVCKWGGNNILMQTIMLEKLNPEIFNLG